MSTLIKLTNFSLITLLCLSSFFIELNAKVVHKLTEFKEQDALKLDHVKEPKIDYELGADWSARTKDSSNYLQFIFTDHLSIGLDRFNFEYDQVELSFEYFILNRKEQHDELESKINVLGEVSYPTVQFNEWTKININKIHKISTEFIFKLQFYKVKRFRSDTIKRLLIDEDQINQNSIPPNDESSESNLNNPIYIRNLKVVLKHPDARPKQIDIFENLFNAKIDDKKIPKEKLAHFRFLPGFNDKLHKYYYSKKDSASLNLSISEIDSTFGDVCLEFSYQAIEGTTLKLKVLNKEELSFFSVADFDNTEVLTDENSNEEKEDADQTDLLTIDPYLKSIIWKKVSVCLRNLCPSCSNLRRFYKIKLETAIDKTADRLKYLAITEVTMTTKPFYERVTKNYFTNWKTNGTKAMNEWFHFTEDTVYSLTQDDSNKKPTTNLQFILESKPYTSTKHFCLLSEWLEIEENEDASYKIMLLNHQMLAFHSTNFVKLEKGTKSIKFSFSGPLVELLKDKPGRIKLVLNYSPSKANLGKKIIIKNLHLGDPCIDENLCHKSGECLTLGSHSYKCQCGIDYSGEHCEYMNMCKFDYQDNKSGNLYCLEHNGEDCIPYDNEIMCLCKKGYQWSNFTTDCERVSKCIFMFCGKDEVCEEKDNEAHCRCKVNYHRNEKTNKCEYDLCKNPDGSNKCGDYQRCVTVLGEKEPRCICPLEHKFENGVCLAEKIENNPFIKQLHNCAHTYTIDREKNKIQCKCFPGYRLSDDKVSCLGNLKDKCNNCSIRQICVQNEQTDLYECVCHMGFSGAKCEKSYCDYGEKDEIRHICGTSSCTEKKWNSEKLGFSCDCDKHLAGEDEQGFCTLKNVCTDERKKACEEQGAICVPQLDTIDNFLYHTCKCNRGRNYDGSETCVSNCELDYLTKKGKYKTYCKVNFRKNVHDFVCDPGFVGPDKYDKCSAGRYLIKISFDFKYRSLVTTENEDQSPVIDYNLSEYYCNNLSFKEKCIDELNKNRQIESKMKESEYDFFIDLKTRLPDYIKSSLKSFIDPDLMHRVAIQEIKKKDDEDAIDFENEGLNQIYTMDLILEASPKLDIDSVKAGLDKICIKDKIINDDDKTKDVKFNNETTSLARALIKEDKKMEGHCAIRPYIYLINSEFKIIQSDLCKLNLIKCTRNSDCIHTRNETSLESSYTCKCAIGFKSRYSAKENGIQINACTDIDECASPELNNCDPESTSCENLLGRYQCNCLENYIRHNGSHCTRACTTDLCKHGDCQVFEKNYEICVCHPGYTGGPYACHKLDNEAVRLRTLLVTISLVLCMLLVFIIVCTYIYVKKIEAEDAQKLLKNEKMIPMDNLNSGSSNSYDNSSFIDDDKIDIQNMERHSLQNDVIREVENESSTNF